MALAPLRRVDERIERLRRQCAADDGVIDLGGGLPDEATFPKRELRLAFTRALSQDSSCLQYCWPEGREKLRELIARRLAARGADVAPRDVIVTSGAQQAIAIAQQVVAQRGTWIAVDPETYPAALESFRTQGLAAVTSLHGAVAAYAMPAMSNPRGRAAPSAERQALLASGLPILEDDAYAEILFGGRPGAPLLASAPDRVLHIGTFSKTLCPGLRVGWLIPPRSLRAKALGIKHAVDLQANTLAQAILEQYLLEFDFDAHLEDLAGVYAQRADRLMSSLRRQLPHLRFSEPSGGFSLWVESDLEGDDTALLRECVRQGVSIDPGSDFRASRDPQPLALRLTFSSVPPRDIDEGVRRLEQAFQRFQRRPLSKMMS